MTQEVKVLKIIESYRDELNAKTIVVCTYNTIEYGEADCIWITYKDEYPQFEEVTAIIGDFR